jgi:hypothetical protein
MTQTIKEDTCCVASRQHQGLCEQRTPACANTRSKPCKCLAIAPLRWGANAFLLYTRICLSDQQSHSARRSRLSCTCPASCTCSSNRSHTSHSQSQVCQWKHCSLTEASMSFTQLHSGPFPTPSEALHKHP